MKELWADIPGWEGLYEVSTQGRVRSLRSGKIMSPGGGGQRKYPQLWLCQMPRKEKHYVHSLVAGAFLGPRPIGADVMHLDDNPQNNMLENLQYGSRKENLKMGRKLSGDHLSGTAHYNNKLTEQDVRDLRNGGEVLQ